MKKTFYTILILLISYTYSYSQTYESLYYKKDPKNLPKNEKTKALKKIKLHTDEIGILKIGAGIGAAKDFTQLAGSIYAYNSKPTQIGWYASISSTLNSEIKDKKETLLFKEEILNLNIGIAWKFFTCAVGLGSNTPYYLIDYSNYTHKEDSKYGLLGEKIYKANLELGLFFQSENKKNAFHMTYSTNGEIFTVGYAIGIG